LYCKLSHFSSAAPYKTGFVAIVILVLIIANDIFGNGDKIEKQKAENEVSEKALDIKLCSQFNSCNF
jgi:hypothetical protein